MKSNEGGEQMNSSINRKPRRHRVMSLILVLALSPMLVGAGEFKPRRYIAPNKMSDVFTRHVRNGLIKRIGLTDGQLVQIRAAVDPHRELLLTQVTAVKESRVELFEALVAHPYRESEVVSAHRKVADDELDLMLTASVVLKDVREILTAGQLREVDELLAEIRVASDLRFLDFQQHFAAGEMLGLTPTSAPPISGG